jgi:hypothetical protein
MAKVISFDKLLRHIGHKLECRATEEGVSIVCNDCGDQVLLDDISRFREHAESHVGHNIECVMYGTANITIECCDCFEVLYTLDKDECIYGKLYDCDCDGDNEIFTNGDCSMSDSFADMATQCPDCEKGIINPTLNLTMACDKCSFERELLESEL